ncbi:MAG: phenylalanine--tRNA ligase subunit alpha [Bacteroides sp.]|nr:MAG: phenylalanine--tRNA ligase subunit alpha [Bacteroides sp.]
MIKKIEYHIKYINNFKPSNINELNSFKNYYQNKKGVLKLLFNEFKNINNDKKSIGEKINYLKKIIDLKINHYKNIFINEKNDEKKRIDFTLPGYCYNWNGKHPITYVNDQIINIFNNLKFKTVEDREIENDWNNFSALNFKSNHPARDMQDTFFIKHNLEDHRNNIMLRTHTTSVQIRYMCDNKPPFKCITFGKVYRNENISSRSHCFFHQIDGFYVNKKVSFIDLKDTIVYFIQQFFGRNTKFRMRSSYFPFTEPSVEVDILCLLCLGKGCKICKNTGWCEILGCGLIDKNVLNNCNIDSNKYNGFAFGIGVERVASLKYKINDIRLFSENDLNFLSQFNII